MVPSLSVRAKVTNQSTNEKNPDFREKEANLHINLIYFDRNFDHPHINVVCLCSQKTVQKASVYSTNAVFC